MTKVYYLQLNISYIYYLILNYYEYDSYRIPHTQAPLYSSIYVYICLGSEVFAKRSSIISKYLEETHFLVSAKIVTLSTSRAHNGIVSSRVMSNKIDF